MNSGLAVPVPTTGVDPRIALATAMHAAPGVFAVLVGSGMSTAAGIPTGWQVVQDLVRRIALAEGVDLEARAEAPETWWATQGRPTLRYDTLLTALASTDTARHHLLQRYFDPAVGEGGPVEPTPAHDALARLCASGRVRLVITTNFDRLVERAMDRRGMAPQVISSPAAVGGMIPLIHARATVLKLHGDYMSAGMRNTPDELASYPAEWDGLLARIFDEFGLLVIGWSADYDVALASAMLAAPSRRYPLFWTSFHGHIRESAARLISARQAAVVNTNGADEFLIDLVQRLERLDAIAARRARPVPLRTYRYMPNQAGAPRGWAALPLLRLRVAVEVGPAPQEATGIIRPEHRDRIRAVLEAAPLTGRLRGLSSAAPALAVAEVAEGGPAPLHGWEPTPGGYQTTEYATFRLGGDATIGMSALADVSLPRFPQGGVVLITLDVAVSLVDRVTLVEVAMVLRDSLVLATDGVLESIAELLPYDAEVAQAETHVVAALEDGIGQTRQNSLLDRVDLSQLGEPSRDLGPSMGFAARISDALTEHAAADLVVAAIETMALANGFLDPRAGLATLRADLGLAPQGPSP